MSKETNTIFEIVRLKQVVADTGVERFQIKSPSDVNQIVFDSIGEEDREVFLLLCLNTKNEVTAMHRLSVGSVNSAIVSPREVFKTAILNNATSIIVAHNHPSGHVAHSPQDFEVTKRLKKSGELLGIDLLDHIITTPTYNFLSFRQEGLM